MLDSALASSISISDNEAYISHLSQIQAPLNNPTPRSLREVSVGPHVSLTQVGPEPKLTGVSETPVSAGTIFAIHSDILSEVASVVQSFTQGTLNITIQNVTTPPVSAGFSSSSSSLFNNIPHPMEILLCEIPVINGLGVNIALQFLCKIIKLPTNLHLFLSTTLYS
jgi:hypothetical protein